MNIVVNYFHIEVKTNYNYEIWNFVFQFIKNTKYTLGTRTDNRFPEAATRGVLCKKVFLEISQNSQENNQIFKLQMVGIFCFEHFVDDFTFL